MKLRRGSTLGHELQVLEEQRTSFAGDIERHEADLEEAGRRVDEARQLEATALLDEPDPSAATTAREEAEARLTGLTSALDVKRRAVEELDRRLEAKRAEVQAEELAEAKVALQRGLARRAEISATFAAALKEADAGSRALLEARDNVKALRANVVELGGDRLEQDADEASWPDVRELVEFVSTGKPLRPVEEQKRAARQRQVDVENESRRERAHWIEQARALAGISWSPEETQRRVDRFLAGVPDDLRDDARAVYESERAKVVAGRSSRARV